MELRSGPKFALESMRYEKFVLQHLNVGNQQRSKPNSEELFLYGHGAVSGIVLRGFGNCKTCVTYRVAFSICIRIISLHFRVYEAHPTSQENV